jgi:hypothetical protein
MIARSVQAWFDRLQPGNPVCSPPKIESLEERRLFATDYALYMWAAVAAAAGNGGDPVQLASGTLVLNTTDLQSDGFGSSWGVTRSWTNNPAYNMSSNVGNGWDMNQNPQILQPQGTSGPLEIVTSGSTADWFVNTGSSGSPVYTPYFDSYDQLTYNATSDIYTLTDKVGDQTSFYGFSNSSYASFAGTFDSYTPASGSPISVISHNAAGNITEGELKGTRAALSQPFFVTRASEPCGVHANAKQLYFWVIGSTGRRPVSR